MGRRSVINKITAYGMLIVASFLFQTTIAFRLELGGVCPSVLVAMTVAAAMFLDWPASACFGVVLGFLCDSLAGRYMGIYTFALLLVGIVAGYVSTHFLRKNVLSCLFLYAVSYVTAALAVALGAVLIYSSGEKALYIMGRLLLEGAYSAAFAAPFYYLHRALDRALRGES